MRLEICMCICLLWCLRVAGWKIMHVCVSWVHSVCICPGCLKLLFFPRRFAHRIPCFTATTVCDKIFVCYICYRFSASNKTLHGPVYDHWPIQRPNNGPHYKCSETNDIKSFHAFENCCNFVPIRSGKWVKLRFYYLLPLLPLYPTPPMWRGSCACYIHGKWSVVSYNIKALQLERRGKIVEHCFFLYSV